jgi:alpha-L-rhamnosidase
MAEALGKKDEAERFRKTAKAIVAKLLERHGKEDGSLNDGTQSDYALLLGLGLLDEDTTRKTYPHLVAAVKDYSEHLSTGQYTTRYMLDVLSRHGDHALAWKLVMQPEPPSFGTMIDSGAVSIWESLDAWHPELGINPNRKGFSHVGWNSIYEWIVQHVVGLSPDLHQPAFKHFFIEPKITPGLTWLNAAYDSPRGRIECNYRLDGETVTYDLLVPPNTTATFITPDGAKQELSSGRHKIQNKVEIRK